MSQPSRTMEGNQGQHPAQVIHVRENSDSELQSLFDVLNKKPQQVPLKERDLPRSFFEMPRQLHSRDSSRDSTNYSLQGAPGQAASHPGLVPNHGRSQSLPAQLAALPLSTAPPQVQHNKQNSVDFAEDMTNLHLSPSQQNNTTSWDLKTGQRRYFENSQEQLQWMTKQQQQQQQQPSINSSTAHGGSTPQGTLSPAQSHPSSPSGSLHNLSNILPPGWEQGVTPDGEIYFINHLDRTTSWFDPRLPKHLQRPGPMQKIITSPHGQPLVINRPSQPPALQQLQQPAPQPTPQQQQQQQPVLPPQPPPQQQISPGQLAPQQVAAVTPLVQALRVPGSNQPQFIQLELERLKQEKDRLQREQEEIARRELLLKEMMTIPKPISNVDTQSTPTPPAIIQSISTSGVDPFLGQGSNNLESHARQNSGDSGLGGMGTNYSLPRTPEGFLSNVDEMDTHETGQKQMMKPQSSDFNMNDLQSGGVCMDIGPLGDDQSGMESDDLVPSLQEEFSSLSNELLIGEVGKMENLLWL